VRVVCFGRRVNTKKEDWFDKRKRRIKKRKTPARWWKKNGMGRFSS